MGVRWQSRGLHYRCWCGVLAIPPVDEVRAKFLVLHVQVMLLGFFPRLARRNLITQHYISQSTQHNAQRSSHTPQKSIYNLNIALELPKYKT